MTEAEIISLLKTHKISAARRKPIWTNPEAKKLYDDLGALISRTWAEIPGLQSAPYFQGSLEYGAVQQKRKEAEARLDHLKKAQEALLRENTKKRPRIHLIAEPI